MGLLFDCSDRNVIPRWREFKATASTGELESLRSPRHPVPDDGTELNERRQAWENHPTLAYAGDFVGTAMVLGHEEEAIEAAEFILRSDSAVPLGLRRLACAALGMEDELTDVSFPTVSETCRLIHNLRRRIMDAPRNAVALVDLARYYAALGQNTPAVKVMKRALILAPDNRFVLRSATRLFVANNDLEAAHDYLSRSPRTKTDPWLLASEVAVATEAGGVSRFVKEGQRLLDQASFAPSDTAELASALAKLDLNSFNLKNARRLFRRSLQSPTENALAQAGWVSQQLSGIEVPVALFDQPCSYEANARRFYQASDWRSALRFYREWLHDEPFSSQPAETGSYLAGVTVGDYILSEQFAREGLLTHKKDPTLLNNLAVALAHQDRLEEAREVYSTINPTGVDLSTQVVLQATRGLLQFRAGNMEEGRILYRDAIDLAGQYGDTRLQALAWIHLAYQEMLAGSDSFFVALSNAKADADRCGSIEAQAMIMRVDEERKKHDSSIVRFTTSENQIVSIPRRKALP